LTQPLARQVNLPRGLDERDQFLVSHAGPLYAGSLSVYRKGAGRTPNDLVYLPIDLADWSES
jgi:hypothetical protein